MLLFVISVYYLKNKTNIIFMNMNHKRVLLPLNTDRLEDMFYQYTIYLHV